MSDPNLQAWRRRAVGGEPEARRQALAARLRAGRLSFARLLLAAKLGDPDARALAAARGPLGEGGWRRTLESLSPDERGAALLAAGRRAATAWEDWEAGEHLPRGVVREALEAAARSGAGEEFVGAGLLETAERGLDEAGRLLASLEAEHGLDLSRAWRSHRAALAALGCARALDRARGGSAPALRAQAAALEEVHTACGTGALRAALAAALLPELLEPAPAHEGLRPAGGSSDPPGP